MAADDAVRWFYRVLGNEINRTLLLLGVAYVFGIASLLSYVVGRGGGGVGRTEFALLAAAMGVIFYLLLYNSSF